MLAIDIETKESPYFNTLGAGYHRKDGSIICIGIYDGQDFVCVPPDDQRLVEWLSSDEDKVFHNSVYDISWLVHGYGFTVNGTIHDTMTRAALIDEYADLDLDSCCKRLGVAGKNFDDTLEKWFDQFKKQLEIKGTVWNHIAELWNSTSGRKAMIEYNKQDCVATYNLFYAQESVFAMHKEAYRLECALQPVILMLNGNGFPIDTVARDRLTAQVRSKLTSVDEELLYKYGITPEVIRSPKKMTDAMNALGVNSGVTTAKGSQSWSAYALSEIEHPVIELISTSKKYTTLLNNFLEGSLVKGLINNRAYSTFSPNKRDDGGTITGRFGSRHINLQQIPAREQALGVQTYGKETRSLFIPEYGCLLGAFDYSAIEMYGLAHESVGSKSDIFRAQAHAHADFHTMTMELSGITERSLAKKLNFTIIYGAGPKGIFKQNKKDFKTLEHTTEIYNKYHSGMPFVKATINAIIEETRNKGYVQSIGGRIHHKPKMAYDAETGRMNDSLYKMPNYKIQGSASDTLKKGLVDAYNEGLFNVLTLHATVHDENVFSMPYTREGVQAAQRFKYCMEHAFSDRWTVPITTSGDVGPSWGYQKSDIWEELQKDDFNFDKYNNIL